MSGTPDAGPNAGSAIEVSPPDIAPYRIGNTGIDYTVTFDSARPGPHALIVGLTHGNEICGAIALDYLLHQGIRPTAGRLSLAFANVDAYLRFDPCHPGATRFVDEDLNRVWSAERLDGPQRSAELDRARALRPLIDSADLLLDLHSMQDGDEPLILSGALNRGRRLARRLGAPEFIVSDVSHAAGLRLRDYDGFGAPTGTRTALLIECGPHWKTATAACATDAALRFLAVAGVVDAAALPHRPPSPAAPQRLIEVTHVVTVETAAFSFAAPYRNLEKIAAAGARIADDGGRAVTTPYDDCVLIMPARRPQRGQTAVRLGRYVE